MTKICIIHNMPMRQKFNSTIWQCPRCLIEKNNRLLKQSQANRIKPSKNALKRKKTPRQKSMDNADKWFSRYIRVKHHFKIELDGTCICKCYTCGSIKEAKVIQSGHWQRRGFKITRFDERNARPQCVKCNYHRSGEPEKFEINLIKEIGQLQVDELKKLSQETGEDNELFYSEMAEKYRKLTNQIIKELSIKKWW